MDEQPPPPGGRSPGDQFPGGHRRGGTLRTLGSIGPVVAEAMRGNHARQPLPHSGE